MSKKAKIVLTLMIVIVLFVIGFAIFQITSLIGKSKKGEQPLAPTPTGQLPTQGEQQVQPPLSSLPATPPAGATEPRSSGEASIVAIALPFVERFGSYSNQSEFEHLQDLRPFMTEGFKKWAQGKIEEQMKKPYQPVYQGVTSKSLSYTVKLLDESAGLAELTVSTQRKEVIGSEANSKVYVQDIDIKMVKHNEVWLVDHAYWK